MVPGQAEAISQIPLHRMPFVAIVFDRDAVLCRSEFDRSAMLVGRANRQCLVAPRTAEACKNIRRKHGADKVAQVLDAVDAWNGTGDQNAFHKTKAAL